MRSILFVLAICAAGTLCWAKSEVVSDFRRMDSPEHSQSFKARCSLSCGLAKWRMDLINFRAHGNRGKWFGLRSSNGCTFGFCELFSFFSLEVNGIPDWKLQLNPKNCREYVEGDCRGFEYLLNFDGAPVRTRFWMSPDSPYLEGEVRCSLRGQAVATNLVVRLGSIPSFLDRCPTGGWRFDGYRRFVRTSARCLGPLEKRESIDVIPADEFFMMADRDYDGTRDGKGNGPSAVLLRTSSAGRIEVGPGWTTALVLRPNPGEVFRFALLEFADRRTSNDDFERILRGKR